MDANLTKILAEDQTLKIRRWNNACHYQAGVKIVGVDEYDISDKKDIVKAYVQEAFDKLPSEMKEQGWRLTGIRYDEDYNYFYADFISEKLKNELQNINPDAAFESTTRKNKMKKLNLTKEQFNKSRYLKNKYGSLKYVSESGKLFKTNKGHILLFKESPMTLDDIKNAVENAFNDNDFHGEISECWDVIVNGDSVEVQFSNGQPSGDWSGSWDLCQEEFDAELKSWGEYFKKKIPGIAYDIESDGKEGSVFLFPVE